MQSFRDFDERDFKIALFQRELTAVVKNRAGIVWKSVGKKAYLESLQGAARAPSLAAAPGAESRRRPGHRKRADARTGTRRGTTCKK